MTRPSSPAQWHGHPYVWAWYVCLAALDFAFIEARCKEAEDEKAPPDAVYKTSPQDPVEPNTWITVDRLSECNRDRVRDYGHALLRWEQQLRDFRKEQLAQSLTPCGPAEAPAAEEPAQAPAAAEDTAK